MLTFEQKLAIAGSFPELQRKDVSMKRVNFHYEESAADKTTVVYHLHPSGNGFVYAGLLDGFTMDDKGFVNIRDFNEDELRQLIAASIRSLSEYEPPQPANGKKSAPRQGPWTDAEGHTLTLTFEEDLWYVYAGLNLDAAFESYEEAEAYLREEGFAPKA
ncbi:hypothetical protein BG53_08285 [Paenibacillus darwinianus]|uniref:Uncharacterized protein n=1 Tax=Paenibacillus darwinianus TaxID=1380763 RepID=A0A9W5W654_9BACL|nr:hypothetical protein [Paenibacillus darwinianus]EXX85289.1 hypothetical protein CH50_09780 [Paenibacillus darwinianus]EXX85493.1 hypothetical protein BG53_08285 [Paenibacillus darwinianus]EXX85544.1 hypothetical protein BG52_08235 [Paenibacillus darwinianus]